MLHALTTIAVFLPSITALSIPRSIFGTSGTNIILSNDDGWAELNIRTFFDALTGAPYHFNVVLSAPSENKSGTGSTDVPPTVLNTTCEFNTCPVGSPPEGFDAKDPRFNYVNSFPVTSMKYGIKTLAPKFFRKTFGRPQLAVAGPNVGLNSGPTTLISGTVGATTAASLLGIPAIGFSGASGSQVSFADPGPNAGYSTVYAQISAKLTGEILKSSKSIIGLFGLLPILPKNIWINVNFGPSPSTTGGCTKASDFKYIFTRINDATNSTGPDLDICGNKGRLPTENSVLAKSGCFVTVSVGDATNKMDVSRGNQEYAYVRLKEILSCS